MDETIDAIKTLYGIMITPMIKAFLIIFGIAIIIAVLLFIIKKIKRPK